MNIKVKIYEEGVSTPASASHFFRLKELIAYFEKRYQQKLEISFDTEFDADSDIYLYFGGYEQRNYEVLKANAHKIFYTSSPYQMPLSEFNFIGVCTTFHYIRNVLLLYVKKETLANFQQNTIVDLLGNPDYGYVSIRSLEPKGILEFLFDYLEAVIAERASKPDNG